MLINEFEFSQISIRFVDWYYVYDLYLCAVPKFGNGKGYRKNFSGAKESGQS